MINTIDTIHMGSTGKSLSSPSSSVSGPVELDPVATLNVIVVSFEIVGFPPDVAVIFRMAVSPAASLGGFTDMKTSFCSPEFMVTALVGFSTSHSAPHISKSASIVTWSLTDARFCTMTYLEIQNVNPGSKRISLP